MNSEAARALKVAARLLDQDLRPRTGPPSWVQYREALRRWWDLEMAGPQADREAIARTYQEILRLLDEVGEPQATQLRRQWAREWWRETGWNPMTGEAEPYTERNDTA